MIYRLAAGKRNRMSNDQIYTGFWIDHSRSAVTGATLTLSISHANILTSALTFLITTALFGSLWEITIFCLHFTRTLPYDSTPAIDKQWVIIRNSASPDKASLPLLKSISWSHVSSKSSRNGFILLLPACLLLIMKLSSFIVPSVIISGSLDDIALRNPGVCGFKLAYDSDESLSFGAGAANELQETMESRRYADERYGNSAITFATEPIFPVDKLPFKIRQKEPCPFAEEMCLLGNKSAISFDTGLLDSHIHLGINAKSSDRIQYRWRSVCTPLSLKGRATVLSNQTYDDILITADEPIIQVNLGNLTSFGKPYTFFYKRNLLDPPGYQTR